MIRRETNPAKIFQNNAKFVRKALEMHSGLDETEINKIISKTQQKTDDFFQTISHEMSIIGNRNTYLLATGAPILFLAEELEEIGHEMNKLSRITWGFWNFYYKPRSRVVKWIISKVFFSTPLIRKILQKHERSMKEKEKTEYDWILEYVPRETEDFYCGINYIECGLCKLAKSRGSFHLMPALCIGDFAGMKSMGLGFKRTKTIGNGADICDFRWYKPGDFETPDGWPLESLPEYSKSTT